MGQTVNLLAHAFGGSNPSLPTDKRTPSELQRSHSEMSGAYSERCIFAEVAQLIEQ